MPMTEQAAYFEFQHFRLRLPVKAVESGEVQVAVQAQGLSTGMPVAKGVGYQFFDPADARKWADDQAAWLVWKWYEDDPYPADEVMEGLGGQLRVRHSWITAWDEQDKYFWPADDPEGEQHCSRCHHVCSAFCKGMTDELSMDHTARGECAAHWIGCPGC